MNFNQLAERISNTDKAELLEKAGRCRGDILTMTTISGSGHPGGSMSSIDLLLAIYAVANINPSKISDPKRDRVIVSHGHISPAVYSCLIENGFIPKDDVISQFRKAGSIYEGHIERFIPGVEWTTGNLGQGLSVGCGIAVAGRTTGDDFHTYVLMGDGEQEKGQIAEGRRFAKKYGFNNITVIVDYNRLQISGDIHNVMPSLDIGAGFAADGWTVIEIDGHNFDDIFGALLKAKSSSSPVMILANTVMGKGVSFMENKHGFHGSTLPEDKYFEAMKELGLEQNIEYYKDLRSKFVSTLCSEDITPVYDVNVGSPVTYTEKTDNRSAFGKAIEEIVCLNKDKGTPVVVFDCDLASSVKTSGVEKNYPDNFYQCGIAEHHASVCAGAASANGVVSFFADFGMFGVDEVYNQQRLNGINEANIKLVTTHVGVDVGEDGKTHMCIDYVGLMRNIFGFKIIVPGDPNETDRAIRYSAKTAGNVYVAMGRSKLPIITKEDGTPFFADGYDFEYGNISVIREGEYPLFSYGTMLHRALKVHDILKKEGISVAVINTPTPSYIKDNHIDKFLNKGNAFVYEDHISSTGLFATLAEKVALDGIRCKLLPLGVNRFPVSGTPDEVFKLLGLDEHSVALKIKAALGK